MKQLVVPETCSPVGEHWNPGREVKRSKTVVQNYMSEDVEGKVAEEHAIQ